MFGSEYLLSPRARLLWSLREALSVAEERGGELCRMGRALRKADARRVSALASHPFFSLWSAVMGNFTRHEFAQPEWVIATGLRGFASALGILVEEEDTGLASPRGRKYLPVDAGIVVEDVASGVRKNITEPGPNGVLFLGDSELVRVLVGDNQSPIAENVSGWRDQAIAGLQFLADVSPRQHERTLAHVKMVASFDEAPGLLQSLSAGELPGFVLARCMNGPAEVADQLVHETSHQLLDRFLAEHPGFVEELRSAPAGYSPFFQQPRPALKLLHGVVSYLEVLRFWQYVADVEAYGPHLTRSTAEARWGHVRRLCEVGYRSLRAVATEDLWGRWSRHLEELCPAFDSLRECLDSEPSTTSALIERLGHLDWPSPIERAELLLALDGDKISRLTVSLEDGATLARALDPLLSPLFSRQVFLTCPERLKGTFTNLTEASFEYYRPPPGATVFAYVGRRHAELRDAVVADESDEAGEALAIPSCCRAHYLAHWEEARNRHEGDLLAWLLDESSGDAGEACNDVILPWQTNAFAMILGRGLTWHFPCSFLCQATISLISHRWAALARLDAALASQLGVAHHRAIVWTPDRAFMAGNVISVDGKPVADFARAQSPEWTDSLRRIADVGPLRWSDDGWLDDQGRSIAELAGLGVRVLLFGDPPKQNTGGR
jgi:hypothetical protein